MWQLLWDFETSGFKTLEFSDLERFGLFGFGFVFTLGRCDFLILDNNNSVFAPHLWSFDSGISRLLGFLILGFETLRVVDFRILGRWDFRSC